MNKKQYQKVKRIFQSAVELAPKEREDYLNKACNVDGGLRREVERLLEAEDSKYMEKPAAAQFAGEIDEAESEPTKVFSNIESGSQFGHYEIVSKIGKGGMGEVFLAKDKSLDREVAIKFLNTDYGRDSDKLNRFIQEAKAASALNHPNILTVFEIGEADHSRFIATEFIEGKTLRDVLNQGDVIPLATLLEITAQIAEALSAAHDAGIVHRDIKPENIMIRRDGYVKVLDFGLAKLIDNHPKEIASEDETEVLVKTETGIVMGTASYMSPEQAKGLEVDPRTDIFSFGVLLYELVTRQVPFKGETRADLLIALLEKDPIPVSHLAPDVPPELQYIVAKSLSKNLDERYQSVKNILADLRALNADLGTRNILGNSIRPTEETTKPRSDKAEETNKQRQKRTENVSVSSEGVYKIARFPIAVFVMFLLGAVGLGYWYLGGKESGKIKSLAVMPFVNAGGNEDVEYLSDGMTESLIGSLANLRELSVKARTAVFRFKGKDLSPSRIGEELNVEAVLFGKIIQRGDDISLTVELVDVKSENVLWTEKYDRKMVNLVSLQTEVSKKVTDVLAVELSGEESDRIVKMDTFNPKAYQAFIRGKHHFKRFYRDEKSAAEARRFFELAIELDPEYAPAWSALADWFVSAAQEEMVPRREAINKARAAARKALSFDPNLASAHASLAKIMTVVDFDFDGAEKEIRKAISLDPTIAVNYNLYSSILNNLERHDEALDQIKRSLELDPLNSYTQIMTGLQLFLLRRFDDSYRQFQAGQKLFKDDPRFHIWLATSMAYLGKYSEAVSECKKYTGGYFRELCLAEVYAKEGRKRESFGILTESVDKTVLNQNPDWVAAIYSMLGEKDKAFEVLEIIEAGPDDGLKLRTATALRVSPHFDNLRDDSRFDPMVKEIVTPL